MTAEFLSQVKPLLSQLKVPDKGTKVYKDECVFSFVTPEFDEGLYVNLKTFQAVSRQFLALDFERSQFGLYLRQHWKRVKIEKEEDEEPKAKPTKFAIGVDGGFDAKKDWEYVKTHALVLMPNMLEVAYPNNDLPEGLSLVVEALLGLDDATKLEQIAAVELEEPRKESKYAKDLPQLDNGKRVSPNPKEWKCEESGMTENLWLNLSTGYIGSGRRNWDGSGGTGAALKHFEDTGKQYPLCVKLGTITPEGADVFSYAPDENDMVLDPHLADHLAHWGINMMKMEKTDKTFSEMLIDANLNLELNLIQESGKDLEPMSGPGFVGLANIGNSCYINSLLQCLFTVPEFIHRYQAQAEKVFRHSASNAALDITAQLSKVSVALLTSPYVPGEKGVPERFEVAPKMLRTALGRNHVEFSTARQQDVHEYYQHVLETLKRVEKAGAPAALPNGFSLDRLFTFELEERLECLQSHKVKYSTQKGENTLTLSIPLEEADNRDEIVAYEAAKRQVETEESKEPSQKKAKTDDAEPIPVVAFEKCLASWAEGESFAGFMSPATGTRGDATKRYRFGSFPPYLAVQMRRYVLGEDWTPKKLNARVRVPDTLDLSVLTASGQQPTEEALPDGAGAVEESVQPDPVLVAQLMSMGFSENGCKRAVIAVNNANVEQATNWIFAHMEDANFNDPIEAKSSAPASAVNPESLMMLVSMGFPEARATKALEATGGDVERATEWLFSRTDDEPADEKDGANLTGEGKYELMGFISHMGPSTACGHYVCHIKKDGKWYIYNDRKVAVSEQPPFDLGYLYFFRRVDHNPLFH